MTGWRPKLSGAGPQSRPLYQRLLKAISVDIETGMLKPGEQLPPQRDLAHALSISVGAVTRAYDEGVRRGVLTAHVGRGTFVVDQHPEDSAKDGLIDLSINIAPVDPMEATLETIAGLRRSSGWADRLRYLPPCGLDEDRRAASEWLLRTANFDGLDWRTLIYCSGAQNAMAIACSAACRPGDIVLTETLTFSGMKALADCQGYRLHGVPMDAEGLRPDALDAAARATGARVLYTLPTLQNPTARTASHARRADIARVARARDLIIIEDDLYAAYSQPLGLSPIAKAAPERTLYVSSLSKILSPGLRAGFLVVPAGNLYDRCLRSMRALMHSPSGVSAGVATALIESGRADVLAQNARVEVKARTQMALAALADMADMPVGGASLHLWLPMPSATAERVAARALTAGVRLTSPAAYSVAGEETSGGLRLCIGSAANRNRLAHALTILKKALVGETDDVMHASL